MSEVRHAIVTGASSGIGAATALALGELGWRVSIGARRTDRLAEVGQAIESAGGRPFAHALDVAQPGSIDAFFDACEAALGPIDVLVSNAGTCVPNLLVDASPADLQTELATNLLGPFLIARRTIRSLQAGGRRGDLVFVSSQNAVDARPYQAAYTAAKAGIEGLVRVLRMELEGTGIRASAVRPGPTGTEFGHDWDPGLLQRILRAWKYWGVQRHYNWMPPESVARAIIAAVTTPEGTHLDLIQVMPEAKPEMHAAAVGRDEPSG